MPDIQTIQEQIRSRLAEVEKLIEPLRAEAEQLTKMAAAFGENNGGAATPAATRSRASARKSAPRRPAGATPGGAKRGRPLGSGNRAQQAVAKIIEEPGITASGLAKSMGISPNYLYRVLPRLEREGKVTKRGRGYHPASVPEQTGPTNDDTAEVSA